MRHSNPRDVSKSLETLPTAPLKIQSPETAVSFPICLAIPSNLAFVMQPRTPVVALELAVNPAKPNLLTLTPVLGLKTVAIRVPPNLMNLTSVSIALRPPRLRVTDRLLALP